MSRSRRRKFIAGWVGEKILRQLSNFLLRGCLIHLKFIAERNLTSGFRRRSSASLDDTEYSCHYLFLPRTILSSITTDIRIVVKYEDSKEYFYGARTGTVYGLFSRCTQIQPGTHKVMRLKEFFAGSQAELCSMVHTHNKERWPVTICLQSIFSTSPSSCT